MRQITFELLRHGPTNNQLLSPLTLYLALCENHAAVTVHVPFEHNQFLHRLRALSYRLGDESRGFQLKDTARVLGDLLGQVPGLVAELNRDPQERVPGNSEGNARSSQRLTHLRIVISASELALLPLELALAPNGFPGAGQSLLLQSQDAICLTREVRRVPEEYLAWPQEPRVLFVAAAPADVDPIPMESHLAVLRRILEPWVNYADTDQERSSRLDEHLVVLKEASCQAIQLACAQGKFSHVHILAHGVEYTDGFDIRYGLALHDPQDPKGKADIVGGERLATALRAAETGGNGALAHPMVVTLASCNSGNQGSVAGMGASVAHALHASGVPIVIASQFPISVAGSMVFVDVMYSGLLWGEDPRVSLNDLRRRLHSQFPTTHDWASLAAYVSLPSDFDRRLPDIQIRQTMRSIEVAMNYADRATAKLIKPKSQRHATEATTTSTDAQKAGLLEEARDRIEVNRGRLEQLVERSGDRKARVLGLLAATEKRCAEVYFSFGRIVTRRPEQGKVEWLPLLQKARKHYWEAFLLDRDSSWGVVQYVSLDVVLRNLKVYGSDLQVERHDEHNNPEALWTLAHVLSINDIRTKDERRIKWGLANLTELYLVALLLVPSPLGLSPEDLVDSAVQRAQDLLDRSGPTSFAVYSTRRQILRYDDWYGEIAAIGGVAAAVERVLEVFPVVERPSARGSTSLED